MDESKMTSTKKLGQIVEQLKAFVAAESYAKKNDPVKKQLAEALNHAAWLIADLQNPNMDFGIPLSKRVEIAQAQLERYYVVLAAYEKEME